MNALLSRIAARHLLARKRQSIVSLLGIVLGVAFFLSVSALMQGSEDDFIRRLVDNSPHITIVDQFRTPHLQPVEQQFRGAVELFRVKPETETRGIRGYKQILAYLRTLPGLYASPALTGEAIVSFAGKDIGISLNGMIPAEIDRVSTIGHYLTAGTLMDLASNPNGIIIGDQLAKDLSLSPGARTSPSPHRPGKPMSSRLSGSFTPAASISMTARCSST
jgi:lipoprotein-releasing system permease protein